MSAIQINDVWKTFRVYFDKGSSLKEKALFRNRSRYEKRIVLKGINLKVEDGEAVGLIGRNGCGKSTLLKLLSRIMYPDRGDIWVKGRVSSLIELGAGFHPDMSGRENIYTNASIFGLTQHEIDRRLQQIIDFSELEDYIDNPVRTYSSGMYMRLAFSVAINVDADVLLIDEILAVGDAAFQTKCFKKLKEIKARGTTIVIVSHSLGQIEEFCERSIWIDDGKVRMIGVPAQVHPHYLKVMEGEVDEQMVEKDSNDRDRALDEGSKTQTEDSVFISRFEQSNTSFFSKIAELKENDRRGQVFKPFLGHVREMIVPALEQQGSVNALLAEGIGELFQKINLLEASIQQLETSKNYFSDLGAHHAFEIEQAKIKLEELQNQGQYNSKTLGDQNFRLVGAEKKLEELQNQGQYNSETLGNQNFRLSEVEQKLEQLKNQSQYNSDTLIEQNYQLQQTKRAIENFRYQAGGIGSHYAQSGEDAVVEYIVDRLQIPLSEVTYLDLGANHAKYLSNTNYFYEHGARGVLVEANPQLIEELTTQRPNDIVLNRCITTKSGEKIPFYILSGDGLSSCDRGAVDETLKENSEIKIEKKVDVETITVQDILKQYFEKPPVLVNVDIEGMELDVLKGFDFEQFRPLMFIVETIPYRTNLVVGEKEETVLDFMKSKGYVEYAFTGINSILIDSSQLENR